MCLETLNKTRLYVICCICFWSQTNASSICFVYNNEHMPHVVDFFLHFLLHSIERVSFYSKPNQHMLITIWECFVTLNFLALTFYVHIKSRSCNNISISFVLRYFLRCNHFITQLYYSLLTHVVVALFSVVIGNAQREKMYTRKNYFPNLQRHMHATLMFPCTSVYTMNVHS